MYRQAAESFHSQPVKSSNMLRRMLVNAEPLEVSSARPESSSRSAHHSFVAARVSNQLWTRP